MIETTGLCKTFRNRKHTVEAVKNVDLSVRQGEIFGFLGPNGAGKTTTMRMLTTLITPTSGKVTVVGYDLKAAKQIRQHIGYVSQKGGCYEFATGYENLVLQGRLYGLSKADAERNAGRLVKTFGMEEYCSRKVITYSGGQRRHIDLGLGVMHNPRLLFLDEPTTGLDPKSRAAFWDVIRALKNEGITVFLTTHYLDEADSLCDTICIMDKGSIAAQGTALELKRQIAGDIISIGMDEANFERAKKLLGGRPCVKEILTTNDTLKLYVESGETALPEILPMLVGAGIPIKSAELGRPSLDEVFLKRTGHSIKNGDKEDTQ
jgi:ABC-2 type transport system ATP-binding protein